MHVETIVFPVSSKVHLPGKSMETNHTPPTPTCLRIRKMIAAQLLSTRGLGNRQRLKREVQGEQKRLQICQSAPSHPHLFPRTPFLKCSVRELECHRLVLQDCAAAQADKDKGCDWTVFCPNITLHRSLPEVTSEQLKTFFPSLKLRISLGCLSLSVLFHIVPEVFSVQKTKREK